MLATRLLRLFKRGAGSCPVDGVAAEDGYALTDEQVDRIARSLIGEAPLDGNRQRASSMAKDAKFRHSGNDWRR